jgi:ubiquinone/menaquinone biosynthesis C-methylase UbiE
LIKTLKRYFNSHAIASPVNEKDVVEAYDLWAANYDSQPGNLMLDLDEFLFNKLLGSIDINNKHIADIGCGTGRHWPKIFDEKPANLTGFDVSPGMLEKLKLKFPGTQTEVITDNLFNKIEDQAFDVIISTLTVAHIENIEEALPAWCRILSSKGDLIITDFHPDILAAGGKRTFSHQNSSIAVRNFVHSTATIGDILLRNNFHLIRQEELHIDESVKHYYRTQNALGVYEKFKGLPVIYGMHFRRA